ncbi:Retinoid X receptor [Aphelenchoides bicaudatus]|nr:Retinoid X receptor [Aphelenchoides bicaudatus]
MSVKSPEQSDSSANNGEPETIRLVDKRLPCQICRLQMSAIIYFNVMVCSGCRAFFRRSVKNNKKYHCLNNKLCGKKQLVPNRRVCKYCRFDRCVKAGMLEAKVRLQSRILKSARTQINNPTSSSPLPNLPEDPLELKDTSFRIGIGPSTSDSKSNALMQFNHLRRQIIFERLRLFGQNEATPSKGALNDMQVGLNEYKVFNKIMSSTENLFSEIDADDLKTLLIQEYSLCWAMNEQILAVVRNQGHKTRNVYNTDGSYAPLNRDHIRQHWSFIYPFIFGSRDAVFDVTTDYMFNVQFVMCSTIAVQLDNIKLDEMECSAFLLLLMTRPACFEIVGKQKTHNFLHRLRNNVLRSLAMHIKCSGCQNVEERLAQIIFLLTDFQNLNRLIQHSMRLLMSATNYRALPYEFFKILDQSPIL